MLQVEFFERGEVTDEVLRFWREVRGEQDAAAFFVSSPEWFEMMSAVSTQGGVVAVARRQGAVVCVLPLLRREWALEIGILGKRVARRALPVLKACGGDLIERGLDGNMAAELWRCVFEHFPDYSAVQFDHVEHGRRLDLVVNSVGCGGEFFLHYLKKRMPHFRLDLPPTLGECLALRSAKSMSRLRQKERALARELGGEARAVELRTEADWAPFRERIDALMNASWQARLLGQSFRMDNHRELAARGWLRGFLLLVGERAVAFDLCYQGMGTLVYEHNGYDQALHPYSPGAILLYKLLPLLYERDRLACVDFGEGDAEYKRRIANNVIEIASVMIVRSAAGLRSGFAVARAATALDSGLRGIVGRTPLGRRARQRLKRGGGS